MLEINKKMMLLDAFVCTGNASGLKFENLKTFQFSSHFPIFNLQTSLNKTINESPFPRIFLWSKKFEVGHFANLSRKNSDNKK